MGFWANRRAGRLALLRSGGPAGGDRGGTHNRCPLDSEFFESRDYVLFNLNAKHLPQCLAKKNAHKYFMAEGAN